MKNTILNFAIFIISGIIFFYCGTLYSHDRYYSEGYEEGIATGFNITIDVCGQGYRALLSAKCPDIYEELMDDTQFIEE